MILLPTKGRPHNIKRFIQAYKETNAELPVMLLVEHDDFKNGYRDIKYPENFSIFTVKPGTSIGNCFNQAFAQFPECSYYGIMADDVVPETWQWDKQLMKACLPDKIAYGDDGINGPSLPTHPFIGGDLVRKIGYIAPPDVNHWYVDNFWKELGKSMDCLNYILGIKTTHHHFINGKASVDATYHNQPDHEKDRLAFEAYMADGFPKMIARLKGKQTVKDEVKLCIGRCSNRAIISHAAHDYDKLIANIVTKGIKGKTLTGLDLANESNCSLLPKGRQMLLQHAIEAGMTHLLMLDDDMGYPCDLVDRLFAHNVQAVGVNGVAKKRDSMKLTATDMQGNKIQSHELSGVTEVSMMGLAVFLLDLSVIKSADEPWFEIIWNPVTKDYNGEDVYFTNKLRNQGVKIYCDNDLSKEIDHWGDIAFNYRMYCP